MRLNNQVLQAVAKWANVNTPKGDDYHVEITDSVVSVRRTSSDEELFYTTTEILVETQKFIEEHGTTPSDWLNLWRDGGPRYTDFENRKAAYWARLILGLVPR